MNAFRLLALLTMVASAGCVERKETLKIAPTGSVVYTVEHKSKSADDLYKGDAVPRINSGWIAREEIEKHDDGSESYRYIAETAFGPGAPLPANFASPEDADADLYLQFPTALKIERRSDGVYYHFSRTYPARAWAVIDALNDRIVREPFKNLFEREFDDWTPDEQLQVVRALAEFEIEKMLIFGRAHSARPRRNFRRMRGCACSDPCATAFILWISPRW